MSRVTIAEAKAHLDELINRLQPGESVIITRDEKVVAKLIGAEETDRPSRRLDTLKGTVLAITSDFDAPLDDFREYME